MNRQWLWLEDQQETVADLVYEVKSKVSVEIFRRPDDLMSNLLNRHRESRLDREPLGLLLDVMLINQPTIVVPEAWHGGEKTGYALTQRSGYDAGLVFYEKVILSHSEMEKSPLSPPPPVIFLTVARQDSQAFQGRLDGIRMRWAEQHGVDPSVAKVAWVQKWNVPDTELMDMIADWDGI